MSTMLIRGLPCLPDGRRGKTRQDKTRHPIILYQIDRRPASALLFFKASLLYAAKSARWLSSALTHVLLLWLFLCSTPVYAQAPSVAISIQYQLLPLANHQYRYVYTVINNSTAEEGLSVKLFDIQFDPAIYNESSLKIVTPSNLHSQWDETILYSAPGDLAEYSSLSSYSNTGIASGEKVSGFAVEFEWLEGATSPGPQKFQVFDPETFAILAEGTTIPQDDEHCNSSRCNYHLSLDRQGFYLVEAKLPSYSTEGLWSLVIDPSVFYAGGFHGGSVLTENGGMPSWIGFSLYQAEAVQITAHDYSGNVSPFSILIDREIGQNQRVLVNGPVSITPEQPYTTPVLEPGFYVIGILNSANSSKRRVGLSLKGESLFGGVTGGWIDSSTGGGEGFGAFSVSYPRPLSLKLLFGEHYDGLGAGQPRLTVYYLENGLFKPYWSSP